MALRAYDSDVLRRLQQAQVQILDAVADVCKQYDIEWFLCYGSALGAVRHKDFIPWDDDTDIAMLRPAYERFLEVAGPALPDWLELCVPGRTPGLATTFAKVCMSNTRFLTQEVVDAGFDQGIFVDVFPYDRISCDERKAQWQIKSTRWCNYLLYLYHSGNVTIPGATGATLAAWRVLTRAAHIVVHTLFTEERLRRRWNQAALAASDEPDAHYEAFSYPRGVMLEERTLVPVGYANLGSGTYPVPGNCELYLQTTYGSTWNQLPPLEQRHNHAPLVLDFGDGVNVLQG